MTDDIDYAASMQGRIPVGAEHHDPINPRNPKGAVVEKPQTPADFSKHIRVNEYPDAGTIIPPQRAQAMANAAVADLNMTAIQSGDNPAVAMSRLEVSLEDAKRQMKAARTKEVHDEAEQKVFALQAEINRLKQAGVSSSIDRAPNSPFKEINERMKKELEAAPAALDSASADDMMGLNQPRNTDLGLDDDDGDLYVPASHSRIHRPDTTPVPAVEVFVPQVSIAQPEQPLQAVPKNVSVWNPPTVDNDALAVGTEAQIKNMSDKPVQPQLVTEAVTPEVAEALEKPMSASAAALFAAEANEPTPRLQPTAMPQPKPVSAATAMQAQMRGAVPMTVPSKAVSYPTKNLAVNRLTVNSVRDIIRASATQSIRMLVKTLGNTVHGMDIMDMTEVDFHYTMYWHRLNSYKKLPFMVPWTCTGANHVERVKKGLVAPETLKNSTMVTASNIDIRDLNTEKYKELAATFYSEYGLQITLPTVRDMITVVEQEAEAFDLYKAKLAALGTFEHLKDKKGMIPDSALDALLESDEVDEEIMALPHYHEILKMKSKILGEMTARNYANHYASLLNNQYGDLAARWRLVSALPPDALMSLDEVAVLGDSYGVNESWSVQCAECGASKRVVYRLDALTFLPAV